jgi:hypothetical protein
MFIAGARVSGQDDRIRTAYLHRPGIFSNQVIVWRYRGEPLALSCYYQQRQYIQVEDGGRRVMPILSRINALFTLANPNFMMMNHKRGKWQLFITPFTNEVGHLEPWTGRLLFRVTRDRWNTVIPDPDPAPSVANILTYFTRHQPFTLEPDSRYRFNTDFLPVEDFPVILDDPPDELLDEGDGQQYDDVDGDLEPPDDENDD